MMTRFLVGLAAGVVMIGVTNVANASLIYQQDFSSDPNYSVINQRSGDVIGWNSLDGTYRVYLPTDGHMVDVYGISQKFATVENQSFNFSVDIMTEVMTVGHHLHVGLGTDLANQSVAIGSNWTWSGQPNYSMSDYRYNGYNAGNYVNNIWYKFNIDFDINSNTANLSVSNRDTSVILYQNNNVAFTPGAFNQVFLGNGLAYSEGSAAGMSFDNISISTSPIPEPSTILLMGTGLACLIGVRRKNLCKGFSAPA